MAVSAATAEKAVVDVTIGSWEVQDWETDGEFYFYSEDNYYAFYFDLMYGEGNEDLALGREYTTADVYINEKGEQVAGVFYSSKWHYGLKSLSLVKTIDEDGLVHFIGSLEDTLGAAFTFHYDEEPLVLTGDTVAYAFPINARMAYDSSFKDWTISVDDGVYALHLDIYSEDGSSAAGVYGPEDFELSFTWVEVYTAPDASNLIQAQKAEATIIEVDGSYVIGATIIGDDGVVYIMTATYVAPHKESEATITATNMEIDDALFEWLGMIWSTASNSDFKEISFTLTAEEGAESYFGTYTIGENTSGSLTTAAEEWIEIYSGEVTVAKSEAGYLTLSGTVLGYDNVEYTLDLRSAWPEGMDEVESEEVSGKKVIRDGQIYILRGNKTYSLIGQRVK